MTEPFQEAVRLIVRLYREPDLLKRLRETPEQLDRLLEAIVEIAKGEESDVAGKIAEVADQSGVDAKSVVDGANFLLSLLHAGPEGNPYRVLGLDRDASQEAIKRRWRLLMQIYHPDRYPDRPSASGGWVAERAKQINKAYATLKDEEERSRLEAEQNSSPHASRSSIDPPHLVPPPSRGGGLRRGVNSRPHATPAAAARAGRPAGSGISWSLYFTPAWRRRLPRLMMATLLGGAAIIVAIVYLSNYPAEPPVKMAKKEVRSQESGRSRLLTAKENGQQELARTEVRSEKSEVTSRETSPAPLLTKEGRGEVKRQENPPIPPLAPTLPSPASGEGKREGEIIGGGGGFEKSGVKSEALGVRGQERQVQTSPLTSLPSSDKIHGTLLSRRVVRKETPREEKKERTPSPEPVKASVSLPAAQHETPVEPPLLQPARVEKGIEVVSAPPPAPPPKATRITAEEVHRFLAVYTAAFERGDIGRFMALFSRSAIENGSRSYEEIRGAYAASFEGKERTRYLVKDVQIVPSEQEALVRGRFEIAQQRKQDGQKLEAQGAIRWRLIREGEQLKVATVDYVRQ